MTGSNFSWCGRARKRRATINHRAGPPHNTTLASEEEMQMNTLDIKKMSTIERLQIMEALWDSLLYEDTEIESPEWHRDILDERKGKIESGNAKFISLEELKASRKS
jgi:putative addiction module component (TIGR02574 family)